MKTATKKRETPATGILQEWVAKLGLRHQGVLMTVIRGCDTAPKVDASKDLTRLVRSVLLNTHCDNPDDAKSFIETCSLTETLRRMNAFADNLDHYPHHFVMHMIHAVEVIGYCHPDEATRSVWQGFYIIFCNGLHVPFESKAEMDRRLDADEDEFGERN